MGPARAVVVGGVHPHGPARFSVFGESDTGGEPKVGKCAVAVIAIKPVGLRVVGLKNIGPAVLINIRDDRGHPVIAAWIVDAGGLADIAKRAVAVVAIEIVLGALHAPGAAIDGNPFPVAVAALARQGKLIEIDLDVIRDKQVEVAIPVVVDEGRACVPAVGEAA